MKKYSFHLVEDTKFIFFSFTGFHFAKVNWGLLHSKTPAGTHAINLLLQWVNCLNFLGVHTICSNSCSATVTGYCRLIWCTLNYYPKHISKQKRVCSIHWCLDNSEKSYWNQIFKQVPHNGGGHTILISRRECSKTEQKCFFFILKLNHTRQTADHMDLLLLQEQH